MKGNEPLKGIVAVITGASSGIGAEISKEFALQGASVVLAARSEQKLNKLASEMGAGASYVVMDVTSQKDVERAVEEVISRYRKIDIWVNNAGYGVFENVTDASIETIADMMDVNYMGMVRCTKAVLPHMLQAGGGHIVNVASLAGKLATPKSSGYSASKHAVLGFTNSLRQELTGTGIYVTAINPGPIDTPFFDRADPSGTYVSNVSWFMLKPQKVAQKVVKAVKKRKAELNLPAAAAAGVKLYHIFPRLFDLLAHRLLDKK